MNAQIPPEIREALLDTIAELRSLAMMMAMISEDKGRADGIVDAIAAVQNVGGDGADLHIQVIAKLLDRTTH